VTGYVVAGTGSRSLQVADAATRRLAWDLTLDWLRSTLQDHPDLIVMSGGAEGYDSCLAHAALHLDLPLWLALPNKGYLAYYWGRASLTGVDRMADAQALMDQAAKVTYVMEEIHGTRELKLNGKHANFWRNDFMVDNATEFLVWDPSSKGTAHCLAQIKRAGLPYEVLTSDSTATTLSVSPS
jgi:hypothetical protein